jgi:hypothetical protein
MRTITVLAAAAMLAAAGLSPAVAQDVQPDPHHPAASADAGGSMPSPMPDAMTSPPGMAPPISGPAGMMSPDMAGMMPMMMKRMCAMMQGDAGKGMMAAPQGPGMPMAGPTDPVSAAFDAINRRMHQGMEVDAAHGPDRAFVEAMIVHHQGAIDMARVILGFGSDPKIRTLAEQVIKAQQGEIALMRQWLAEQPQP